MRISCPHSFLLILFSGLVAGLVSATATAAAPGAGQKEAAGTARGGAGQEKNLLSPEQAVVRLNETVQLEMTVRSSKLRTERDEVDLNSHTSFRDPANLAVVIPGPLLAWYSYQGIHDLPKHFFGKTIRVVGVVEDFAGQRRILIADPAQILVVK